MRDRGSILLGFLTLIVLVGGFAIISVANEEPQPQFVIMDEPVGSADPWDTVLQLVCEGGKTLSVVVTDPVNDGPDPVGLETSPKSDDRPRATDPPEIIAGLPGGLNVVRFCDGSRLVYVLADAVRMPPVNGLRIIDPADQKFAGRSIHVIEQGCRR